MAQPPRPVVLVVLDGWGYSEETSYNAIHSARKPVWDRLWASCPHTLLSASGTDVGLPDRQMGNSEVGHMHIGAGRLVHQDFSRIQLAIEDGEFSDNPALVQAFDAAAAAGKAVHLIGLLSPGGVHSHEDHFFAAMELAARRGVARLYVHGFLDGRDRPPKSAAESIQATQAKCWQLGVGRIGTLVGRYFAMDRNRNWERTRLAWDLIVDGEGAFEAHDPLLALDEAYGRGETDEFVRPTRIVGRSGERRRVEDGDVVVFMNFRADRARQLSEAFLDPDFRHFERRRVPRLAAFVTLTSYSDDFDCPVAFPPERLRNTFGEYIAGLGLKQLRLAETEKYAHVTFFFNGGEERAFAGEDRILVPSPHVATYDLAPEMSAVEVTDRLVEAIESGKYDAIVCNYANPDMVGHTGVFEAAVKAIETIDGCLGRLETALRRVGGEMIVTADHGNAEMMRTPSTKKDRGQAHTAHTTNLVPFLYLGRPAITVDSGTLADIAPTLLALMGLAAPREMSGRSLVRLEGGAGAGHGSPAARERA